MDMERNIENEVNDLEQPIEKDSNDIYENISKLDSKLDELNEIYNPTVNTEVVPLMEETIEEAAVEPLTNNEINMPVVAEEDTKKELDDNKSEKGQYILITILTIILIALLLLMVYFTSSL